MPQHMQLCHLIFLISSPLSVKSHVVWVWWFTDVLEWRLNLNIVNKYGLALFKCKWSEVWYGSRCLDCGSFTKWSCIRDWMKHHLLVFRLETCAYKSSFLMSWEIKKGFCKKTSAALDELLLTRYNVSCCRITSGLQPVKSCQPWV